MSKNTKAQKPENTKPKKDFKADAMQFGQKAADFVLKWFAVFFLIATSLETIRRVIENAGTSSDLALAGAILVESVAIYLIVHKR